MVKRGLIIGAATALLLLVAIVDNISSQVTSEERQIIDELGVKIVFPVNGQPVPIGELTIFGTSTDNIPSLFITK
jgi:hypothetical protein